MGSSYALQNNGILAGIFILGALSLISLIIGKAFNKDYGEMFEFIFPFWIFGTPIIVIIWLISKAIVDWGKNDDLLTLIMFFSIGFIIYSFLSASSGNKKNIKTIHDNPIKNSKVEKGICSDCYLFKEIDVKLKCAICKRNICNDCKNIHIH